MLFRRLSDSRREDINTGSYKGHIRSSVFPLPIERRQTTGRRICTARFSAGGEHLTEQEKDTFRRKSISMGDVDAMNLYMNKVALATLSSFDAGGNRRRKRSRNAFTV